MTDNFDIDFLPASYVAKRRQLSPARFCAVCGLGLVVVVGLMAALGLGPFDDRSLAAERDQLLSQVELEPSASGLSNSGDPDQPKFAVEVDPTAGGGCSCLEAIDNAWSPKLSIMKIEILRDMRSDSATESGDGAKRTTSSIRASRSTSEATDFSIIIRASAADRDELTRLVEALRASSKFDRVTLSGVARQSASASAPNGDGFEFTLNLNTRSGADTQNGNAKERS